MAHDPTAKWDGPAPTLSDDRLTDLIAQAERDAQFTAALIRLVIGAVLAVLSLGAVPSQVIGGESGIDLMTVIWLAFAGYVALSLLSLFLARSRWFRLWHGGLFIALDMLLMAAVIMLELLLTGIDPSRMAMLPPVFLVFILLALAAMRYSPWILAVAMATLFAGLAAAVTVLEAGWLDHLFAPIPAAQAAIFEPGANIVRAVGLVMVAAVLALAVRRSRITLIRAVREGEARANLARTLSPEVAHLAATEGLEALRRGQEREITVLFADVRGFTGLAEGMAPADVSAVLARLRQLYRDAITAQGGMVDKFIGDGVFAIFGLEGPPQEASRRALAAAEAMLDRLAAWNERRVRKGRAPIRIGIGVHCGHAYIGAVGDEDRIEFTALGDSVNVGARVEAMTKQIGTPLLATRAALDRAGADLSRWAILPDQTIRGRQGTMELARPATDRHAWRETPPA